MTGLDLIYITKKQNKKKTESKVKSAMVDKEQLFFLKPALIYIRASTHRY